MLRFFLLPPALSRSSSLPPPRLMTRASYQARGSTLKGVGHETARCLLYPESRHVQRTSQCPLHPRKPPDVTNPPVFSPAGPKLLQDDCGLPNADAERADTNSDTRSAVISVARTIARIVATTIARIVAITVITLRIWI